MSVQRPIFLKPEQITPIKQKNIEDIVNGLHLGIFSKWLLTGNLHEEFKPKIAVAFFPDIFYAEFTPDKPSPEDLSRYRKTASGLILPERILQLEKKQYQFLVEESDQILQEISPIASRNLIPTAIIVFNQPNESVPESAYLFCPTPIPPSAALRFVKQNTRLDG